jgi:hypothetical protein
MNVRTEPSPTKRLLRDLRSTTNQFCGSPSSEVGSQDHTFIEQLEQCFEIAATRRIEKGVNHAPLAMSIDIRRGKFRARYSSAGTARQLPRGFRGASHNGGNLGVGEPEQVVQNEGKALCWSQGVQHNQEGKPDRVGEERLVLGLHLTLRADDRIRQMRLDRLLTSRPTGAQHV